MEVLKQFATEAMYNMAGVLTIKFSGLEESIARDPNMLSRNAKVGVAMTGTTEISRYLTTGDTKIQNGNFLSLWDDIAFFGLAGAAIEQLRLAENVDSMMVLKTGNRTMDEAITETIVFTGANWVGSWLASMGHTTLRFPFSASMGY